MFNVKKKIFCLIFILFALSLFAENQKIINYNSISTPADADVNTSLPVFITGDNLIYENSTSEIFGEGNILIRQEDTSLFADKVYINTETGDVSAEGNILMIYKGTRIYSDKIYYNLKNKSAYSKKSTVINHPWICSTEKMKKEENKLELEKPSFTTCDFEKPHYRMESSMIYIYVDEKIETWHTVMYLGNIPILYFPYYTQSLRTNKLPFEFKFGHNKITGFYVFTKYNHYFDYYNEASFGWDYYELQGNKYSLDMNYGLFKYPDKAGRIFTGRFSGFYNQNKSTHIDRWQIDTTNSQIFNERIRANQRINIFSDKDLRKDNLQPNIDTLQQEYSGDLSMNLGNHSFSISVADYEQLNTVTSKYYTRSRILPHIQYNLMSSQIIPFVYYNHNASITRTYNPSEDLYYKNANISPGLSLNIPKLLYILTLNGGASLNTAWNHIDNLGTKVDISKIKQISGGDWLVSYSNFETIQMEIIPPGYLRLNLTHNFSRQLNKREALKYEGITNNILNGNLYASLGSFILNASTTYNLLKSKDEVINDKDRFSLLNINSSLNLEGYYFSAQSTYSIFANMIKSLNLGLGLNDGVYGMWNIRFSTTFINNLIDSTGHFNIVPGKDVIYFNTSLTYALTKEFRITMTRWYDLIEKELMEHSYAINWYVHCWEVYFTWTKRQDNVEEIFFSVFISALPQYKFNKPSTATPGYDLQFGN